MSGMGASFEREVQRFLGPKGPLARLLPRYETRPEQSAMASAVLRALAEESILVVEAGTGTGKTLAYLVPAIYAGERVVISTGTKALQEQLMRKDLPVLSREFKLRVALMKGRSNYLCRRRHREFGLNPTFKFREEIGLYDRVQKWAETTVTGDRAEIRGLPDDFSAWREMSCTGEQCLGQKCDLFRECFITAMRGRAQAADIVVVNHHLFFADLALRASAPAGILPEYRTVIFDEAHALAEIATEYFGRQASTFRLADLAQDIRRLQRLGRLPDADLRAVLKALDAAEAAGNAVFKAVAERGRELAEGGGESLRFGLKPLRHHRLVLEEGERAGAELKLLAKVLGSHSKQEESFGGLADRADSLAVDLAFILAQEDPDHVFWAETRGRRTVVLRASPTELGPILSEMLFTESRPLIFTSATLAIHAGKKWSFAHFRSELGLADGERPVKELWLASSYNWPEQAMLYVPKDLPEPSRPEFIARAAEEMERILAVSRGRAFLLFTSYRNLEAAYELLAPRLPFPVLKQGEASKPELLERFRAEEESVLFATSSFWEGVDVAGQSLSCVIVDKLPFASPGDPLLSARLDRIRSKGGNPFSDYQLPAAVIALKQGLGRLIRGREDFGILAVLDSRLHSKQYGRTFLASLPPAPLTTRIEDLEAFIAKRESANAS